MKKKSFSGTVCWITGASSGIGEGIAKELNKQNAFVILSARSESNLEKVKQECTYADKVVVLPCDLENTESLSEVALSAWNVHQKIDYIFLNAGIAARDTVINTDIEVIRKVMNTNFIGGAVITKTLLPLMVARGSGTLVVTSSLSGKYGIPKLSAYAASKHALHGFYESLRAEHAKDGIKVIMFIPGLIRTGISVNALTGQGKSYGKMMKSIDGGMSADECARKSLKGILKGRNEVIVAKSEKLSLLLNRFFPALMAYIIRSHPLEKLRSLGLAKSQSS